MAEKLFSTKLLADYEGIDGESTPIEEDSNGYNRALNYEYAVGNSLRGRVGCQIAGNLGNFFAIFPYNFSRTTDVYAISYNATTLGTVKVPADGASVRYLVALNRQLWILDQMTIPVTYVSGSYPFTWYSYVNGANIDFVIKANGTTILDTPLGDGLTSNVSIWSLLNTIDGLAQLSVSRTTRGTCPPFAIVNGAQTSVAGASVTYATRQTLTVLNTPHTFHAGDVITFPDMSGGIVISTTATTIVYAGNPVTVADGDILGYMNQTAAAFPIDCAVAATSGTLNIMFPYWRLVPESDKSFGNIFDNASQAWTGRNSAAFWAPATSVNAAGNLYITCSGNDAGTSSWANHLIKTDGVSTYRAGAPKPTIAVTAPGAGALAGTYKYKSFFRRYDAQGNIVDGTPCAVTSITYGGGTTYGQITISGTSYTDATGFQSRSCYKYLAESPAAGVAFTVDDNTAAPGLNAFVQPGDIICLTDNTAQKVGLWHFAFGVDVLGTLHRTRCTFYDGTTAPSSIKVEDSSGYTIPNNAEISTGLTVVTLRSTAGGNNFYVLSEVPYTGYGNVSFFDNVTDAVLVAGEQYIEAELGKEHDPPPACSLVCQHDGGLVVARAPTAPNTVAFSTVEGIEYFPIASNSFDVPSTLSGSITAIASDTDDRLAVFKERAYYDIVGDLDGGTFSVNVRNEGDFGVTSQASLVRVSGSLVGLSRNGFIVVHNGILDPYKFKNINTRLINQTYNFNWAVAFNDPFTRQYVCSIPVPSANPVSYALDYSRPIKYGLQYSKPSQFAEDYQSQGIRTFERSYPTKIDQGGGIVSLDDGCYHLSCVAPFGVFRRLRRFNCDSPTVFGDGDSFIDNTQAISYILESNPYNFGDAGQLKQPVRLRVWSIPNDYIIEGWFPFSVLVETGASASASFIGGTNNNATTSTITFGDLNTPFRDIKLVPCKTHFFLIRFTTSAIRTAPFLTAYGIMLADNYEKEDYIK